MTQLKDVKIGDELICRCGSPMCKPFKVEELNEDHVSGTDDDGVEYTYTEIDFYLLSKLTKLERALR